MIRKSILNQLSSQGMGRHSATEIFHIADIEIGAVSDFLGDGEYFFGNKPSTTDAQVFGMFAVPYYGPYVNSPIRESIQNRPNLVAFLERIKNKYYPHWDLLS